MSARAARVLFVGLGGIGHPALASLCGQVGRLRLVDDDRVERSNVHRLAFAEAADEGASKLALARRVCLARGVREEVLELIDGRFVPETAAELLRDVDLVVEGADNYPTKFLVADACHARGTPVVHGAAVAWVATVLSVRPGSGPCYRCVYEEPPPGDALDCSSGGIYGPVTSVAGALMAAEALRLLAQPGAPGSFTAYEALDGRARTPRFSRRNDCPLCGISGRGAPGASRFELPTCAAQS